jgi:TolA binding protein trimerisation
MLRQIIYGLLSVTLFTGAAHAGLFDDDEARKAVNTLNAAQKTDKAANEAQFARIDANIKSIENSVKNLGLVELAGQIEGLKSEIKALRGQNEVLANSIETTQKKQRDFYLDLDSRIKRLEETPAAAPPPAPTSVAPSVSPQVISSSPTTTTTTQPVIISSPTTASTVVIAPPVTRTVPEPPPMPGTKKK